MCCEVFVDEECVMFCFWVCVYYGLGDWFDFGDLFGCEFWVLWVFCV